MQDLLHLYHGVLSRRLISLQLFSVRYPFLSSYSMTRLDLIVNLMEAGVISEMCIWVGLWGISTKDWLKEFPLCPRTGNRNEDVWGEGCLPPFASCWLASLYCHWWCHPSMVRKPSFFSLPLQTEDQWSSKSPLSPQPKIGPAEAHSFNGRVVAGGHSLQHLQGQWWTTQPVSCKPI